MRNQSYYSFGVSAAMMAVACYRIWPILGQGGVMLHLGHICFMVGLGLATWSLLEDDTFNSVLAWLLLGMSVLAYTVFLTIRPSAFYWLHESGLPNWGLAGFYLQCLLVLYAGVRAMWRQWRKPRAI